MHKVYDFEFAGAACPAAIEATDEWDGDALKLRIEATLNGRKWAGFLWLREGRDDAEGELRDGENLMPEAEFAAFGNALLVHLSETDDPKYMAAMSAVIWKQ